MDQAADATRANGRKPGRFNVPRARSAAMPRVPWPDMDD